MVTTLMSQRFHSNKLVLTNEQPLHITTKKEEFLKQTKVLEFQRAVVQQGGAVYF